MYRFEAKRNLETPKDVKLTVLQNEYFNFLIFLNFELPNGKNSFFPKMLAY